MDVQHLQKLVQQSAHDVGSLRGVNIQATASPASVGDGVTVAVVITAHESRHPEYACDFELNADALALSDTRLQTMVERSLEVGANEFNAEHGKGSYDAGLLWKRR